MAYINENYNKLKAGYLFPEIARRVKAFTEANPEAAKRLIRCGIGDVTEALPEAVRPARHLSLINIFSRRRTSACRSRLSVQLSSNTHNKIDSSVF